MAKCDICREEHNGASLSCEACNKVVIKYQGDTSYSMPEVRNALRKAFSHKNNDKKGSIFNGNFHSGIISQFNSKIDTVGAFKDAFILTLDHKNPPDKELVVSLNIINKMKGDILFYKFKKAVIALGEQFKDETNMTSGALRLIFEE